MDTEAIVKNQTALRLLWLSNAMHVPTGYGAQTRLWVPRLFQRGYPIAVAGFFGQEGGPSMNGLGITTYPRLIDPYMNDIIDSHYKHFQANVLVSLIDVFVFNPQVVSKLFWVAWCPIDSEPMLPAIPATLKSAKRIWAMSRHGERLLTDAGFTNVDYVPHGINHEEFHPLPEKDAVLARLKQDIGLDFAGKFVVTMNSANKGVPSRKGFNEAFAAFKMFSDNHPDALLYVHSEAKGIHQGEPLEDIRKLWGIPAEKVLYAPQYHYVCGMLPPSFLNDIYNVSDVFLHTSHGEGFGIPIVEAQTCGVPVIVTDASAMSELCFAGWKVPGLPFAPAPGMLHRIPLIPKVAEALEASYQARGDFILRKHAIEGAAAYNADVVFERYMKPAMDVLETMIAVETQRHAEVARLKTIADNAVAKNGNGHTGGSVYPIGRLPNGKKTKKKARAR